MRTSVKPTGLSLTSPVPPHGGNVEVAFEVQLELADLPATLHSVGMQSDRDARAKRRQRRFRGIRRRIVAQQARWLIDDVGRQVANEVEVAEPLLGDRVALQSAHRARVRLRLDDQLSRQFLSIGSR